MAFPIDPSKSPQENLLALVNFANSSDLTLTDVDVANIQAMENAVEGARNTTVLLDPKPEGRFNVAAGGVTVNYRRLSFAELIQNPVEIKAQRTTTLSEIHQAICNAYGLIPSGVAAEGTLPGPGTILPGETFKVTINPSQDGSIVYFPKPQEITITWDGVWLEAVLTGTNLPGFQAANEELLITLSATDHKFTYDKLDALVLAQAGDWSNTTPLKIVIEAGCEIISPYHNPNTPITGQYATFEFDAKYANFESIHIENHGDVLGGGGSAKWGSDGVHGVDAIKINPALAGKVTIDNQGRIGGGGGGGGSHEDALGGGGAPFGYGANGYASMLVGADPSWVNPYRYGGRGGDIGKVGNSSYGGVYKSGAAGYAVRGPATFLNRGTIFGTTA